MRKCRIGTAKFFTLLLLLYRTSAKYQVIFKHKDKYSINSMCNFFGVSRSGYYAFLKRMNTPDRYLPLAEKIKECQEESHGTYGYRRVHIWLERQGIYRNPKTVLRVIFKDFIGCSSSGLSRAEPPQSVRESYTPPHNPDVDISCRA